MTPFHTLPPDRQQALRDAYATASEGQPGTCSMEDKITRFAAWLAPQGISFGPEDLPARRKG